MGVECDCKTQTKEERIIRLNWCLCINLTNYFLALIQSRVQKKSRKALQGTYSPPLEYYQSLQYTPIVLLPNLVLIVVIVVVVWSLFPRLNCNLQNLDMNFFLYSPQSLLVMLLQFLYLENPLSNSTPSIVLFYSSSSTIPFAAGQDLLYGGLLGWLKDGNRMESGQRRRRRSHETWTICMALVPCQCTVTGVT